MPYQPMLDLVNKHVDNLASLALKSTKYRLVKHDLVRDLKDVVFEKDKLCSSCQARKQVGNTHPKEKHDEH